MIDNDRMKKMTDDIIDFVKTHKPIYFFYNDVTKIAPDVFALFKILNVNLKAVLTRNPKPAKCLLPRLKRTSAQSTM